MDNTKPKRDKAVIAALAGHDHISFSTKTGEYKVKMGFYYRHGRSEDTLAAEVRRVLPHATIIAAEEHYNNWPRDSWWEVRFTVPPAEVKA